MTFSKYYGTIRCYCFCYSSSSDVRYDKRKHKIPALSPPKYMNSNSSVAMKYHRMVTCYISRGTGLFNSITHEGLHSSLEIHFIVTISFHALYRWHVKIKCHVIFTLQMIDFVFSKCPLENNLLFFFRKLDFIKSLKL